tara:strand:- start:970 stop:1218 length:249 start_codon:yes stop_codon:yes gene_type:complete
MSETTKGHRAYSPGPIQQGQFYKSNANPKYDLEYDPDVGGWFIWDGGEHAGPYLTADMAEAEIYEWDAPKRFIQSLRKGITI